MDTDNPCRCCLTRESAKDLKTSNTWLGKCEVYADMLKECFEINIKCEGEEKCGICEVCVTRLRDAFDFKKQVVKCQQDFLKKDSSSDIKDESYSEVKIEYTSDTEAVDDADDYFDNYVPEKYEEEIEEQPRPKKTKKVAVSPKKDIKKLRPTKSQPSVAVKATAKPKSNYIKSMPNPDRELVKKITQNYVQKVLAERKRRIEGMLSLKEMFKKHPSVHSKNPSTRSQAGNSRTTSQTTGLIKGRTNVLPMTIKQKVKLEEFPSFQNNTILKRKHRINMTTLVKYSNCTPFRSKTLNGYACMFCRLTFTEPKDLREHTNSHRNEPIIKNTKDINNLAIKVDINDLSCNICNEKVPDIKTLKTHLISEHKKRFHMEVKDYVLEFKISTGESYPCALCNSTFETFKMLLQHMNNHYRNYICDTCGIGFINMTKLKTHKTSHETGEYLCQFCEKVFPNQIKKAYHEKFTHSRVRYNTNCPHCDESFQSYYKRNQHMVQVHNMSAASYKCNICDRNFLLKAQLTNHTKKVHLMERNHICLECGQAFYQKQYLRDHMIKHNGERIHKCDICNKAYARKKTLREHMRIHNNDRRHKCHVCFMAFVQKCSLKSHLLSNHGIHMVNGEIVK